METMIKESPVKTVNPATNRTEKTYEVMTDGQLDHILQKAREAFAAWKNTSFEFRAARIRKAAAIFRERKDELARLAAIEMGKCLKEGVGEVMLSADILEYYADNAAKFLADKPLESPQGKAFLTYDPIGVILSVQPWNFPYYQVTRNAAPNLMAGNTVVLKHASNIPQCAEAIEKIFREAGIEEGVYTNIFVPGSKTDKLAADARVAGVMLTGSEPAGSSIAEVAGKNVKKSVIELGGSDPFIILEDADLDLAVNTATMMRLSNCGQICTSPKRIIVMESMAEEFLKNATAIFEKIVVGDPLDSKTQLGPLSSVKAMEKVLEQVESAVSEGARVIYGGKRLPGDGAFMQPTVLTGVRKGMRVYSEEIFGPVLNVFVVKNEDEAVALANDSEFGLGGSVISRSEEHAVAVARRIETGMVWINRGWMSIPQLPFGGVKKSGYGRELSPLGIHEFVNPKLIYIEDDKQ